MNDIVKPDAQGILTATSPINIGGAGKIGYNAAGEIIDGSKTRLISGRTIGRVDVKNGGSINTDRQYIAKFESLSFINCYPPPANSLVDPPPILSEADINRPLKQFEELLGRDYTERVLMKGQYLVLVPLEMQPTILKMARDKVSPFVKLDSVLNRLDISSYGYSTKVNLKKYNRAVSALMQSALLALGFEIGSGDKINAEFDKQLFPSHIVEKMYRGGGDYMDPFDGFTNGLGGIPTRSGTNPNNTPITGETQDSGADVASGLFTDLKNKLDEAIVQQSGEGADVDPTAGLEAALGKEYSINQSAASNIIKFITNIDSSDAVNTALPWSVYYINGTVGRNFGTQSNIDESLIAKSITDIGARMTESAMKNTQTGQAVGGVLNTAGVTPEMLKEAAYHDPKLLGGVSGFLVENTYIPSVIRNAMMNISYTVNLKQICAGSDPYSLFRPLYVLAQLFPYVIPTNVSSSAMMVPESPMYCSAFVKGVMNLPKAAITQMSINTNPSYQTSEGIPLELDITLTIQPLQSMSTMPNFDTIFGASNLDQTRIISQMFNPLSPFNLIATFAGQNTVLSKFPYGIWSYFVTGTISRIYSSIVGVPQYISDGISDLYASSLTRKSRILSLR